MNASLDQSACDDTGSHGTASNGNPLPGQVRARRRTCLNLGRASRTTGAETTPGLDPKARLPGRDAMRRVWIVVLVMLGSALSRPAAQETTVTRMAVQRDSGVAQPVLADPGFEDPAPSGTLGWRLHPYGTGPDDTVRRGGLRSLRIDSQNPWADSGASQTVALNRTEARPLRLRAFCRAGTMPETPQEWCAASMTVTYMDGRQASQVTLTFPQGPHDWLERETVFVPAAPVQNIQVWVGLRRTPGTVWFDDVSVEELELDWDAESFDGTGMLSIGPPPAATERSPAHRMEAKDGSIAVALGEAAGHVTGLELARTNYADPEGAATAGFSVRDWSRPELHRVRLPVHAQPSHLKQQGLLSALGIQFTGTVWSRKDRLEVRIAVDNRRPEERALTVYFALPVDARGWTWWDGLRASRKIGPAGEYSSAFSLGTGGNGTISRLPVAAVTGAAGLAAWCAPDRAQQARFVYNAEAREFVVAFDVALTPKGGRPPNQAEFVFNLAGIPRADGLREAVARWHADSPAVFAARKVPEGGVLLRFPVADVPGARDFSFAYNLIPWWIANEDYAADDRAGVATLLGLDPAFAAVVTRPAPQSHAEAAASLEGVASNADPAGVTADQRTALKELRETARMIQATALHGMSGEMQWEYFPPWSGLRFTVNPDPSLKVSGGVPNKADHAFRVRDLTPQWSGGKRGTLDGAWVAGLETAADRLDFRPTALAALDGPLTFETATRRPCVPLGWAQAEFLHQAAAELRKRKKVLLGHNGPHWCFPLAAPFDAFYHDYQTTATDDPGSAAWDAIFLHRAALAGDRPVMIMFSGDFNQVKAPQVRAFTAQCAAYGFYPGWIEHRPGSGSNEAVWRTPAWAETVRAETRRAIELVRELRSAGWRPSTGAAADPELLRVERWGDHKSGTLAFSIYNPTDGAVSGTLRLRTTALELPVSGIRVRDRAGGDPLSLRTVDSPDGPVLEVPAAIGPREVRVLFVRRG